MLHLVRLQLAASQAGLMLVLVAELLRSRRNLEVVGKRPMLYVLVILTVVAGGLGF